ncbi:MAG: hypothetical protein ACHQIG_02465 [Acidimicrobiia bacterium]
MRKRAIDANPTVVLVVLGLVAWVVAGTLTPRIATAASPSCALPTFGPGADYQPVIDRSSFTSNVDNPWFPLTVGTTFVSTGTKDGKAALDLETTTARTRTIDNVETRVVEDRLFLDGVLEERTSDYYAQDACGNVWYFGEDTAALGRSGRVVDTSGSFHAGTDGAQPGLFMQAQPDLHRKFRQERLAGQAEDTFTAVDLATPVSVPYGSFASALRTAERTALEPGVLDNKYYVRGIGQVVETSITGPRETLHLVDVVS